MRLIVAVFVAVVLAANSVVFAQTKNFQKATTDPKKSTIPVATDPVSEFEKIVAKCRAAFEVDDGIKVYFKDGEWFRELTTVEVRYDVRKTDSLVAPIVGMLDVLSFSGYGRALTEIDAKNLTFTVESANNVLKQRKKLNFIWRDDRWIFGDGISQLDHRRADGSFTNDMGLPIDISKGRSFYGRAGQCFP